MPLIKTFFNFTYRIGLVEPIDEKLNVGVRMHGVERGCADVMEVVAGAFLAQRFANKRIAFADDFAHKLVGPAAVQLPSVGARVAQGEAAAEIGDADETVGVVSPVDGTVVAVNPRGGALEDPYGAGWLFKVNSPRLAANLRQLLHGPAAQRLVDEAGDALALRVSPELGHVLQDGGAPVHGLARALAGDAWADLARSFLLT
jgi:glycine cleavage system H lipoate-binding protein